MASIWQESLANLYYQILIISDETRDGHDFTSRGFDARNGAVQIIGMLEEIQMLPLPFHRIVDATKNTAFIGKARSCGNPDSKMQFVTTRVVSNKVDFVDFPRRVQVLGHAK